MSDIVGTVISVEDFLSKEEQKLNIAEESKRLCKDRNYIIPDFQREIRWEEEQIIELINNIGSGRKFLGTVILAETKKQERNFDSNEKDYRIIDGQQRLVTILMILRFTYSKYKNELGLKFDYCNFINESFLKFEKFLLSGFSESVDKDILESDDLKQIPHFRKMWNYIVDYAKSNSYLSNANSCRSFISNLNGCLLNVIVIASKNSISDGIRVFLDVNMKGMKLDTEDIFKSYLFYQDNSEEIRRVWSGAKRYL